MTPVVCKLRCLLQDMYSDPMDTCYLGEVSYQQPLNEGKQCRRLCLIPNPTIHLLLKERIWILLFHPAA